MNKMNIAAQLYTVREFTRTEKDLRETFRKIKDIGYQAVQISAIGPIPPDLVKAMADEAQLRICATHTSFQRLNEDLDQVILEHQLWNCRYVGLGAIPEKSRSSIEGYKTFVLETAEIVSRLHQAGLQFIYHNHSFEFDKFGGSKTGMDLLLESTNAESFGFELDLYWVQAGGADPADWIQKVEGRMAVVHLKDMAIIQNRAVTAEIGMGNMNYNKLIQACRETGVEWYVVEQDECRRDPFESLAISYRNLQAF
ncbi:sugar phosphate isomerase/epimerase family protein [Paenibacillus alba]|uniref:Sugar phosphate isomerase/epimerase n=1 Tax=Paenibacillus alba TaxID=1197127 RepID=A0ABU6G041_9BACL|nr:sugar phosphate isomerase/epimerase [Paenibacillus alba]MEC0227531.1 sugar phosphate isomerase/epimerase [Paenibacillus alba]